MDRKARYLLVISFLALTTFLVVAFSSFYAHDWPAADSSFRNVRNLCGPLGAALAHALFAMFGRFFAWVAPVFMMVLAFGVAGDRARSAVKLLAKTFAITVLMTAFFALVPPTQQSSVLTGSLGRSIAGAVSSLIGEIGGTILVTTLLLLVLLTEFGSFGRAATLEGLSLPRPPLGRWFRALSASLHRGSAGIQAWRAVRAARRAEAADYEDAVTEFDPSQRPPEPKASASAQIPADAPWLQHDRSESSTGGESAAARQSEWAPPPRRKMARVPRGANGTPLEKAALPPLSILRRGSGRSEGYSPEQLKAWSEVLEDKLSNYGIEGKVTAVNHGPMVTTFEFEPAPGVKIKDIVSRADDLALAMRARSLRLIAPIPGRAVVGIEIPNPEQETVFFYDVLKEVPDRLRYSGIMIALGSDAHGKPFNMNLCAAPHLLMAGTTGSGKSVALNTFLASILFQYRPTDVQLLLIDPKMVEMSIFNGIPHLLHPVITDPRDAVRVFNYAIREMERRNQLLRNHGVKNIESFNSKVSLGKVDAEDGEPVEKLPYIVLVVDELADLVLTKGVDFESMLSRLSNMARAVGIHMIVATQRPSVDVIDGKTKANFPTRIAFRVATKVDSRTILDTMGAEKLLGKGDMLYVDAKHPEALRLHGSWISEDELEELVAHWKQYDFDASELELYTETAGGIAEEDRDSFFEDARQVVMQFKQGSTSLLQRKLHVGYARAARILDQLESAGVVGPPEGSKPREVLITEDERFSTSSDV